jgi:uncharacterized protein (DUF2235 family)
MRAIRERPALKRIVIACDGTWNRLDATHPTNVVKAAQAVLPTSPDGTVQLVHHLDGVGSGRGTGRIARALDRGLGGVFGQGVLGQLEDAYRVLVFNHAPGDALFIFGYSRGAFMARSLAGLIRTAGIVRRDAVAAIPEAFALYRRRGAGVHADDAEACAFRARHSGGNVPTIAYLGVWDTVGALGVPGHLRLAALANRGLRFHDTKLSRRVRAARHAVAIDERRRAFPPTLWDNLEALNVGAEQRPYHERWFPGDHGAVGGGRAGTGLSDDACLWVLGGAAEAGLALDGAALARMAAARDFRDTLRARRSGLVGAILRHDRADRTGPDRVEAVAPAARARWRADPGYRPRTLARVAMALDAARPLTAPAAREETGAR